MKKLFPGYYTPSKEEFKQLWDECVFTFDANMLLNVYRYSRETQDALLTILEDLKDRIWIPHQAALEFSKNRANVIEDQSNAYNDVNKMLDDAYEALDNQLKTFLRHPSIAVSQVLAAIRSGIDAAKKALGTNKDNHQDLSKEDPIGDKLAELIDGKVGDPFAKERLLAIYKDGQLRYQLQTPPGYSDTKTKPGNDKYGDLVLWLQMIEYAKHQKKPIIFVTAENKEDWWRKEKGQIVAPRPELINEMHNEAGVGYYQYQGLQFLKYAQEFLKLEVQKTAVQEIEEVGKQDQAYENAVDYFTAKDWISRRVIDNDGAFDNLLMRRAREAATILDNPMARSAIEKAQLFDRTHDNPLIRRALEDAKALSNPLITENLERAKAISSTLSSHPENLSTMLNDPVLRRVTEMDRMLDNPTVRQIVNAEAARNIPIMRQAIEAARLWQNHPLAGLPLPRDINIEVSPKRSGESQNVGSHGLRIEVIPLDHDEESDALETISDDEEVEALTSGPPYEFNNYPVVVTLIHRPNSSHPFQTSHRIRRPTKDEWYNWGHEIVRDRRYFSQAEIDEHNADIQEDEKASEIWSPFYSEWNANKSLYNRILLEIAGVQLDSNDQFPRDQFRALSPETVESLRFETKTAVIKRLYECYCDTEKSIETSQTVRVQQRLSASSQSQTVVHVFSKPSEEDSKAFRTSIVTGEFGLDEENREIVRLRLNLSVADDFYNLLLREIENATVDGKLFSPQTRQAFLDAINPVYKLRVLEPMFRVRAWFFKTDDISFP